MNKVTYDYIVIGSGPGGYVSAIRAAQLGLKTAVVEKSEVGGICLNWGCIPTKSLLESAHFLHRIKNQKLGIHFESEPTVILEEVIKRSRDIAQKLSNGIQHLFKKYKVDLIHGRGYIRSENEVELFDKSDKLIKSLQTKYICVATGARAKELPHLNFSHNVISYREAMLVKKLPKTILIIGAGAIGCEFADFFSCLGSQVSLIEAAEHILPAEEAFLGEALKKVFMQKKITVLEKTSVTELKDTGKNVIVHITKQSSQEVHDEKVFDIVLLAIGIEANVSNVGLENVNAKIHKGRVEINEFCEIKGAKNIFAIGDITHGKQLAHKASHEGVIAAEKISGKNPHPFDYDNVPSCIYTSPQIASVGLSSSQLAKEGVPFKEGNFPLSASGKAMAAGETTGFLRSYIHEETGALLGAHYIGENVTELISNFSLARSSELTYHEVLSSIFPHPTLAEAIHESVGHAMERSVNF